MSDRKLFYAYDKKEKRVFVDDIEKLKCSSEYYCPQCKERVIAKMGEKNIWHFAHIGKNCGFVGVDDGKNTGILDFGDGVVEDIPVKFERRTCIICKGASRDGVDVKSGFICQDCYKNTDASEMKRFI